MGAAVATEKSSQILDMGMSEKRRHAWTPTLASLCDLDLSPNLWAMLFSFGNLEEDT